MRRLKKQNSINAVQAFKQRLKRLREERGLTYTQLANLSGYAESTTGGPVTRVENSDSDCLLSTIERLAKGLNVSFTYLAAEVDNPDPNFAIGKNIRFLRLKRNISAQKLAELSSLNDSHIKSIERGDQSPTLLTLERISNGLGIEFADLFKYYAGASSIEIQRNNHVEIPTKRIPYNSIKVTRELLQGIINLIAAGVGIQTIERQLNLPADYIEGYLCKHYKNFEEAFKKVRRR